MPWVIEGWRWEASPGHPSIHRPYQAIAPSLPSPLELGGSMSWGYHLGCTGVLARPSVHAIHPFLPLGVEVHLPRYRVGPSLTSLSGEVSRTMRAQGKGGRPPTWYTSLCTLGGVLLGSEWGPLTS